MIMAMTKNNDTKEIQYNTHFVGETCDAALCNRAFTRSVEKLLKATFSNQ